MIFVGTISLQSTFNKMQIYRKNCTEFAHQEACGYRLTGIFKIWYIVMGFPVCKPARSQLQSLLRNHCSYSEQSIHNSEY